MKRNRNQKKPHSPLSLDLEEIIGLTTKNSNGLASSIWGSKCVYIAGSVVVLYDSDSGIQSHLTAPNRVPKALSSVALSRDGSIVAAGESGKQPAILVWDCTTLTFRCELKGHQYGVRCMSLSPDGKYLISVGSPRDGCICLWDWQNKILLSKVKASSPSFPVASIAFCSLNGYLFVTAGKNHFKFWKIKWSIGCRPHTRSVSVTMEKTIDLDKEWSLIAVAPLNSMSVNSARGHQIPFYAVTEKGTLCMISPGSSIINSVNLEVDKCFALSTSENLVACACNNGAVKLFGTRSLNYTGKLCYADVKRSKESNSMNGITDCSQVEPQLSQYPDAIACQFSTSEKLAVVYDDHSLYIWDINDIHKATRCCVLVGHSGCIWDIQNIPCENMHDRSLLCAARGCSGGLSFTTCSSDGTIRLWDLALQSTLTENSSALAAAKSYSETYYVVGAGIFERESVAIGDSFQEFRSMAVSSDGKHLAAGDYRGNIHIFNLYTSEHTCIQDAHGTEILSLSFSFTNSNALSTEVLENDIFLASGGRDGKIQLFNSHRNFNRIGIIECHSSAVTAVKVSKGGREILSCSEDRFLALHRINVNDACCSITCLYKIATSGTIYDMVVDDAMKIALTVGQEKKIDMFDIQSGKLLKCFKHEEDTGNPTKVTIDGSCSYVACSYSSKCILVYDYLTGEMLAKTAKQSDVTTGIIFLPDCKHLVSVGVDGCIFVWILPASLSSRILQRINEVPSQFRPEKVHHSLSTDNSKLSEVVDQWHRGYNNEVSENVTMNHSSEEILVPECSWIEPSEFRFSVSRLPKWAQRKFDTRSLPTDADSICYKAGLQNNDADHKSHNSPKEDDKQDSENDSIHLADSNSSKDSQSPPETCSWSKHPWSTIHTVCMDFLDSPRTCHVKSLMTQGSTVDDRSDGKPKKEYYSNKRIKLSPLGPGIDEHNEHVNLENDPSKEPDFGDDDHANLQDYPSKDRKDFDVSQKDSQENDNYTMKFGNFSVLLKRDGETPLTKSNSRFVVRRKLLEGRNKYFGAHASGVASLEAPKDDSSTILLMKQSTPLFDDGVNLSPNFSKKTSDIPTNIRDEKDFDVDTDTEVEIVRSCEDALFHLEAAAKNAMQSLGKLATLEDMGEHKSRGLERLTSIEKNIHTLTKLLQPDSNF